MSLTTLWLESSLLLGIAALMTRSLGRRSAQLRDRIWSLTFLALAALPLLNANLPQVPLAILPATTETATFGAIEPPNPPTRVGASPHPAASPAQTAEGDAARGPGFPTWTLAWLIGALAAAARTAFEMLLLSALARRRATPLPGRQRLLMNAARQSGFRPPPRLCVVERLQVPIVWGWARPTLMLPAWAAEACDERLRMVLLHELTHLKRRDHLMQPLQHLICAAYWLNPLVWLAARWALLERERACDEAVLRGGADRCGYARLLVEAAAQLRSTRRPAAPALTTGHLQRRIVAVLQARGSQRSTVAVWASTLLIASTLLLLAAAEVRRAAPLRTSGEPAVDAGRSLDDLLVTLRSGGSRRAQAAWALGEREDPGAVDALLEALTDDDPELRGMAAWALGEIKSPAALPALLRARLDADVLARAMIVRSIGEVEVESAIPDLIDALRDPQAAVRSAAASALGEFAGRSQATEAVEGALDDVDPGVRQAAVLALRDLAGYAAAPALRRALGDSAASVRGLAAEVLGQLRARDSWRQLAAALRDPVPEVRAQAAEALGRIGDPGAVEALIHATRDPTPAVREWASWAMDEINPGRHR